MHRMSQPREIAFPEKDLPLREDVSMLGRLLGEVIVEQHGEGLLAAVERVRKAAIARREGDSTSADRLVASLGEVSARDHLLIIKAFSSYLRLVNIAEDIHRIRRNRAYLKDEAEAQRGSLEYVIAGLARQEVGLEQLESALAALHVEPVFTAHPTEATRRSILEKSYSIVHRLVERFNPDLTPAELAMVRARIRDAVTASWQTRPGSQERPTVADELDHILFYLLEVIYRMAPAWHESLQRALESQFPAARLPDGLALKFGSWVGGDMDGNPNVGPDTIRATLATQREAIVRRYLSEVAQLARFLSQTRGDASFNDELEATLSAYQARFTQAAGAIPRRHLEMPYRCFLVLVSHRLRETLREGHQGYSSATRFAQDIALVERSLTENRGEHAGLFVVRRLQMRIRTFGFHLATLDVRQDAELHREVLAELLDIADWSQWSVEKRSAHLGALAGDSSDIEIPDVSALSEQAARTLDVFRTIRAAQETHGHRAIGLFVISMTQGADDVLATLALARLATGEPTFPLDVAPLLETVDDLEAGPGILRQLLQTKAYRRHLESRDMRQVIMVGYSDSNKDAGIVASRWGLQQAQAKLLAVGRELGVEIVFFHGRGGTVSRGGGNLVSGITGAPADTVNGYVRVTEQGEVINQKYGMRPLALRNLELMTGAALQHQLSDVGQYPEPWMCERVDQMARAARGHYRALVHDSPDFIRFFRRATPLDVIERLAIGSRPASRRSGEGVENLRAIPWVFSWAQTRIGFPGVFGVGTALETAVGHGGLDELRRMYRQWRFFHAMINDVEMVLAKSELAVGRRYAELAGPELRGQFELIEAEFDRARTLILEIKQSKGLLDDQPTLRRNIRLRNPYVDPLHIIQIELLQRWREARRQDDELLGALKASVNGIALGIQNTG
ncbi:MAG: phosphoenolpyruvate carboxylase [Xanthomonadales bacterium]|nr:phosphoenolpyruvate carboxylase [Xanthomonadales bacterium]